MFRIRKFEDHVENGEHVRVFAKDEYYHSESVAKFRFRFLKKKAELGASANPKRCPTLEHVSDCATEYVISSEVYTLGIQCAKI